MTEERLAEIERYGWAGHADILELVAEVRRLTAQRDRFAGELWNIRMAAERWTVDTSPVTFANVVIHGALGALGGFKQEAQRLAGEATGSADVPRSGMVEP